MDSAAFPNNPAHGNGGALASVFPLSLPAPVLFRYKAEYRLYIYYGLPHSQWPEEKPAGYQSPFLSALFHSAPVPMASVTGKRYKTFVATDPWALSPKSGSTGTGTLHTLLIAASASRSGEKYAPRIPRKSLVCTNPSAKTLSSGLTWHGTAPFNLPDDLAKNRMYKIRHILG